MIRRIAIFLFISTLASAQLQRYDNFAATTASVAGTTQIVAVPNAAITVFLYPGVGNSCAGGGCVAATTYTSRTGVTSCGAAVPLTRPTANTCIGTADNQGNLGFWVAAGAYQYCVAAASFTTQCYNVVLSAPLDFATAGVFTNTQMNLNIQSLLNNCSPTSEYHFYSGASANETEAITGCSTTPVGSPVNLQNVAVNGYAVQQSASTPTIAVQGLARATGTGLASATAGTFIISDGGVGNAATNIFAVQPFVQLNNTTSGGVGVLVGGALRAQPTGSNPMTAIEIAKPQANAGGPYTWVKGIRFDQGATLEPTITNLVSGFVGIEFNPVASGNTQPSQGLCFLGTTSGGAGAFACDEALATGDQSIVNSQAGTGLSIGINGGVGGTLKLQGGTAGTVTHNVPTSVTSYTETDPSAAPTVANSVKQYTTGGVASFSTSPGTLTIGTGNVTTAGTAINTLTCQAQTGITVTGAATTDNVVANIGAALPATWQTGIVLSAHVTATNTVTVYLCNPTATATITPAATQVNVRVWR